MTKPRDELLERYAEAVAQDTRRPSVRVRNAARAHAQMLRDQAAAVEHATGKKPTTRAANQPQWALSLVASMAVVGLASLLYLQIDRGAPADRELALGTPAGSGAARPSAAAPAARTEVVQAPQPEAPANPQPTVALRAKEQATTARKETTQGPAKAPQRQIASTMAGEANASAKASAVPPTEADAASTSTRNQAAEQLAGADTIRDAKRPGRSDAPMAAAPAAAPPAPESTMAGAAPSAAPSPLPQRARGVHASPAGARFLDAVRAGNMEAIELLLTHGVDVNNRDNTGNTALMVAVKHRQAAAVRKLLAMGADPSLVNREGLSALQLAERQGFADIARLLQPTQ